MKRFFLSVVVLFFVCQVHAQKVSDKALSESCDCVKKIDAKLTESEQTQGALGCLSSSIGKYSNELRKEFNITSADNNVAMREIGMKLWASISQKCPAMVVHLQNLAKMQAAANANAPADISTDTLTLDSKICAQFKSGKYTTVRTFVNNKEVPANDPTSYSEFKDGFLMDYEENKKYVSKWTVKWTADCAWEQTLVESNSPNINTMFKKGDKLMLKGIGSTKDKLLYVATEMMGANIIVLFKKQ